MSSYYVRLGDLYFLGFDERSSTCRKFRQVRKEGDRTVAREMEVGDEYE